MADVPNNIVIEHILKAIKRIDDEGIKKGAHSTTYDLLHEGRRYPPKLVVSWANQYANGEELDRNSFGGGLKSSCFRIIKKAGFEIVEKELSILAIAEQFIEDARAGNQKTKHYPNTYKGLSVKASFGQGALAKVPWVAFLKEDEEVQCGIYPVLLLYKKLNCLVLSYGVSRTRASKSSWNIVNKPTTSDYLQEKYGESDYTYSKSFICGAYEIDKPLNKVQLEKDMKQIIKDYNAANLISSVNNISEPESSYSDRSEEITMPPLNQIFYGPPGTGKTFKLQNILKEEYTDNEIIQDRKVWLSNQIDNLNWFEILVLVLLDANTPINVPDMISHEYFNIKAELNNRSANLKQTAWAALQTHALLDSQTVKYAKRVEPLVFDKTKDSLWFINADDDEQLEEYRGLLFSLVEGPKKVETIKRFEFVTFHQSYGYEEFIEGLRPVTNDNGDISYTVKPGVFKRLCKRAEADPKHQYALVIDEINRGNISKIFGELISLIEIDKREGCDHELTVTLPYSGLPFSVPSNVDIIGSMNTADRSLTHIDVALRRRFEFKELRTNYSLLGSDVEGINIKRMLYAMNQRIELLLDREHILGHALLMKVTTLSELENAFKNSLMPLLEEYFFEDWDNINQVLNSNAFIEEQKDARSIWLSSEDEHAAKTYKLNFAALSKIEEYQQIYANIDDSAFIECDVV